MPFLAEPPTELMELEDGQVLEVPVQDDIPTEPVYEGPLGVRSLVELCRGKMMRLATRYADIGDLQYAQHELFFKTRPVEQLEELEDNSPGIKVDTDHLWAEFLHKEDPEAHAKNLARPVIERKSWRKIYFRTIRKAAAQEQAEWQRIKEEADEEERAKKANKLKVMDRAIPPRGRRRRGGFQISGGIPVRPTSILERARKASAGRREIMHHASSVSSSAPRRTRDPFRGSTLLATTPGSSSAPQTKLPPLPTNRIQQSDHEMPPAYSVMPLVKEPAKPATPKDNPMKKDKEKDKKRVPDVAFFEDAGGKVAKDKPAENSIRPREINVVKTRLLPPTATSELMSRKRSRQDDSIIDLDGQQARSIATPSVLTSSANITVASGTTRTSTPPRPKPAVPLNSLFMPKKKRKL